MERAALIGGIVLAVAFALGSFVRHNVHVDFGDHEWGDTARAAYVEPAPGNMEAQTFSVEAVRVVHAAGLVRVIPEDRTDVSVEIANPGKAPMPTVKAEENKLIIDGLLSRRIDECREDGGAELDGYGVLALSELPQITLRTPREVAIGLRGAVRGEIGAAQSVDLSQSGCGRTTIADVAEALEINNSGSGSVEAGAARTAEVHLAGSGSARIGAIGERLEAKIAGSGQIDVQSLQGELEAKTAGSGDFRLGGGAVTEADVEIAGSGSVDIGASVETLDVKIAGSGDVTVRQGVGSLDASLAGSGDVRVASVSGEVSKSIIGSGDVVVGAPPARAPAGTPEAAAKNGK
ncbi:MAG: DUF2807 domain-containing protein [Hyphomonadaceae bacterium]|nr:DUF2807 domain-containing protein [Hyphomonadaceae bacterium]